MKKIIVLFVLNFFALNFAQVNRNDTIRVENHPTDSLSTKSEKNTTEVLTDIEVANSKISEKPRFSPSKAGLYSAVLPGLGQYYNHKYWKIPIVWGAIGTGVGFVIYNNNRYKKYRNAFVAELNGQPHEFSDVPGISKEILGNAQDTAKRQRDYAIAITSLVYILNIVDAVVDAHLYEGRKDPDLALKPSVIFNEYSKNSAKMGLSLSYNFK